MFGRNRTQAIEALAVVVALAVFTPEAAHARFGKSSSPSSSGSHSGGGAGGSHSSGSYHSAAPVPSTSRPYVGPSYGTAYPRYYSPAFGWRHRYSWWYGYYPYYPFFGYVPPYSYYPYGYYYVGPPPPGGYPPPELTTRLGLEGQMLRSNVASGSREAGNGFGISLGIEGRRFGFSGQFQSFSPKSEDGFGTDHISLLNLYFTYALIASPHGRFRLEAGASTAFAPDVTYVGPSGGFSAIISIFGPFALEGSTHYTPFPYRQFDWQGGLGLALGPLNLRGGWRRVWLDDRGQGVTGGPHQDAFGGPYVGLAVVM